MTQIVLEFDAGARSALRKEPSQLAEEVKTAAVVQWYAEGRISQGKGAEILGISRGDLPQSWELAEALLRESRAGVRLGQLAARSPPILFRWVWRLSVGSAAPLRVSGSRASRSGAPKLERPNQERALGQQVRDQDRLCRTFG